MYLSLMTASWLTRHREWYLDTLKLQDDGSKVYAIYSMTLKALYGARTLTTLLSQVECIQLVHKDLIKHIT
ncbi:MAG: hypothetical protein ACLVFI_01200 [Christensenellales bacterium]